MSTITTTTLWCDHMECDDADAFVNAEGYFRTAKEVRAHAIQCGWTQRNGKDFCPDHSVAALRGKQK